MGDFIFKPDDSVEALEFRMEHGDVPLCPRCRSGLAVYWTRVAGRRRIHTVLCPKNGNHVAVVCNFSEHRDELRNQLKEPMSDPLREQDLLDALRSAEQSGDAVAVGDAVCSLSLYYSGTNQFLAAAPFWRRGAELLAISTAPDSRELATYLHNMASMCLIPAGLFDEARATLERSREIYQRYFGPDDVSLVDVNDLLDGLSK